MVLTRNSFQSRSPVPLLDLFNMPKKPAIESRIEQGFKDMAMAVNKTLAADSAIFTAIFLKYFSMDQADAVLAVLRRLTSPATIAPDMGADRLGDIIIDGQDFGNLCGESLAYEYDDGCGESPSQIHFCYIEGSNSFAYPDLDQLECSDLDSFVSFKMISFGIWIVLHELT